MKLKPGKLFVLLWMLAGSLTGCGLKGDLYLPESAPAIAAAEEDDEDKDGSPQAGATDSTTPDSAP
jgi:predicted small lipoprotein YifL